ncbi:MAG: hypothetical protein QW607_06060 [Desulfurococcaceae archaeon]
MPVINLFGQRFLIKQLTASRFKKPYTLATPPPWFRDPDKLSKAQVQQVLRFSAIAHKTAGKRLAERMDIIRAQASGPTGLARPRIRTPLPKIGKILTLAERYGLTIPDELRAVTMPTPTPTPAERLERVPRLRT